MKMYGQIVDKSVQVDTKQLGFRLINFAEHNVGQTQTYEHYFPFDEETR